jgi:hypothetical protein
MNAVSPRNPNLCLSCEQLAEDDSAELERLLAVADPESANPTAPGRSQAELVPVGMDGTPYSDGGGVEHASFVAPA